MEFIDFKEDMLAALKNGTFLQLLSDSSQVREIEPGQLSKALSELHNASRIDLNELFKDLSRECEDYDFFPLLEIYEQTLPYIEASILSVSICISRLLGQAGNDLAAGSVYGSYIEFCYTHLMLPTICSYKKSVVTGWTRE